MGNPHDASPCVDGPPTTPSRPRAVRRRIASADQRIVLLARDRGCTRPGCTVAGAHCQVHHAVNDWAHDGQTNIDDLTPACPKDNRSVKPGGWKTHNLIDSARL